MRNTLDIAGGEAEDNGFKGKFWKNYKDIWKDEAFTKMTVTKARRLLGIGLAEVLGVAWFVSLGCSSLVPVPGHEDPTLLNIALAFSLGIGTSVIVFGPISGAVLNPAVAFTLLLVGKMSLPMFLYYSVMELIGGILGGLIARGFAPVIPQDFCVNQPQIGTFKSLLVEVYTTSILCFSLCNVVDPRVKEHVSFIWIKFAMVLIFLILSVARYSNACFNPARIFGPALLASSWKDHWIYWAGPFAGALLAGLIYQLFFYHYIYDEPSD